MASLTRIFRSNTLRGSFNLYRFFSSNGNVIKVPLVRTANSHIQNPWIWQQQDPIKSPLNHKTTIDLPSGMILKLNIEDPVRVNKVIEAPTIADADAPKEAARLIVIRRKKMKKHKLRKLRKKMKFLWAKVRQKRELRKEKEFQAQLILQCKNAEAFSAETYVEEKIGKLNEIIIPKTWKGRSLPEFIIREKMGLPPKK